jgi:hypothetical protein
VASTRAASSGSSHIERDPWLSGFEWALPAAFSGPVSTCRFEQGDVLHSTRAGYDDWAGGAPGAWLQVLDPPRSARAAGAGADASRFATHWESPVQLDLAQGDGSPPRRLDTTQGRLFTCLWHGDLAVLEASGRLDPPLLLADLQRALEASLPALRRVLGGAAKKRGGKDASALLFVIALDRASDASLAKADSIATALAARFEIRSCDATPAEADIPDAERHHPALAVRGIRIEQADPDTVTEVLKAVLYSPGAKPRASESDEGEEAAPVSDGAKETGRTDRFSLARHGLLAPLVDAPQ